MKVFAFEYNPCTFESGYCMQSLHTTEEKAFAVLEKFRQREIAEYKRLDMQLPDYIQFRVRPIEVE